MTIKPCKCSDHPPFRPSPNPPAPLDDRLASVTTESRNRYLQVEGKLLREAAFHEAGHVIAGRAAGRAIEFATIGDGGSFVRYDPGTVGDKTPLAFMLSYISGTIAEGIARGAIECPPREEMLESVDRARGGQSGTCDRCCEAELLVRLSPHALDEVLVETWRGAFRICLELFDDNEWRGATLVMAKRLNEEILMYRDDIEAVLGRYDLREGQRRVLARFDLPKLLPAWG